MDGWKSKALLLLKVSRPVGWPVFALMFFGGLVVSGAEITPLIWLQIALLTFPYCIVVYGLNDIYDFESDSRNDRKGGFQGEILSPENRRTVLAGVAASSLLILGTAALTFNPVNFIGAVLLIAGAMAYSVPPVRLKERPPLDSISNGFGYVLLPAVIGYSFGGSVTEIPSELIWLSVTAVAAHSASTILDYTPDKKSGVKTFATVFGKRETALFVTAIMAVTVVFSSIDSFLANLFFGVCLSVALIIAVKPDEKLALRLTVPVYIAGLVLATVYLINLRYLHIT